MPRDGALDQGFPAFRRLFEPHSGQSAQVLGWPATTRAQLAASLAIQCAAFSAIISVGLLVLPLVMVGITPASTTRKPATPRTRKRLSTTARGSSSRPMRVVPTG